MMKHFIGYIFDLDDTLYCEHNYVQSGFRAVAKNLALYCEKEPDIIYSMLFEEWKASGRGKVFDEVCRKLDVDLDISWLVQIYRHHTPNLCLYDDALKTILELKRRSKKLGIITDGNSAMQWNKIESLGIKDYFDFIIVTDDLGKEYWKPSETPFRKMAECLELPFEQCVYVGDNPHKDFVTAKKLGMGTVRIIRPIGDHMKTRLTKEYEADWNIYSLEELL